MHEAEVYTLERPDRESATSARSVAADVLKRVGAQNDQIRLGSSSDHTDVALAVEMSRRVGCRRGERLHWCEAGIDERAQFLMKADAEGGMLVVTV